MRKYIAIGIIIGLSMGMLLIPPAQGLDEIEKGIKEIESISVVGRLTLEKHGEGEWLILHGKDTITYTIKGDLAEKLKDLLLNLGETNLVSVNGNKNKLPGTLHCSRSYRFDDEGNRIMDTRCISHYDLEVTQIIEAKKSDEEMPPPKRNVSAEQEAKRTALRPHQGLTPTVIGEIQGTISSVNLKSPLKTVEITNQDLNNPLRKIVLLINSSTRIVKKLGDEEAIPTSARTLRKNQKVVAQYARDEFKNAALFITVLHE